LVAIGLAVLGKHMGSTEARRLALWQRGGNIVHPSRAHRSVAGAVRDLLPRSILSATAAEGKSSPALPFELGGEPLARAFLSSGI
jgi:hypothetical protein